MMCLASFGPIIVVFAFCKLLCSFSTSASKSGPVSVLLPFLEGPQTGPVPESFRMQKLWIGTVKNHKNRQNWL